MLFDLALLCIGIILYTYFGYTLLILFLSIFVNRKVNKFQLFPEVALVIAAYNEEDCIEKKIKESLDLDYPKEKLKVYVVSDASSDKTDDIVNSFENDRVQLIRIEGRLGKTEARNRAIRLLKEEIIVFSDATTKYSPKAIKEMMENFADPEVGMVTGKLIYEIPEGSTMGRGQGLFWKYENLIKTAQTKLGTLTGSLGCMTAFRRELYTELPPNIIEDFTGPQLIIQKGYRVVFEKDALCFEDATLNSPQEWKMRVRVIRGGMTGLLFVRKILNPIKYPLVSFQLFSHKILRWLVPVFALLAFFFSVVEYSVNETNSSLTLLSLQLAFYAIAFLGFLSEKLRIQIPFVRVFQYIFILNLAAIVAIYKTLTSELEATWEPDRKEQTV